MGPQPSTCTRNCAPPPTLLMLLLLLLLQLQDVVAEGERGERGREQRYSCPSDFVRHGSSCYLFSAHMASWFDAHFACKDRGGELAILEKGWEDRNMRSYLNKPELARLERWIGGIYNWEIKRWVWGANGGQPLKYQGFSQMAKDGRPKWQCIVMDPLIRYKWGGRLCIDKKHYICEVPLHVLPQAVRVTPPQPHAESPSPRPSPHPSPRSRQGAAEPQLQQGDAAGGKAGKGKASKEALEERRRRRRERRKQRQLQRQLQRQRQKQRQKERLRQRQKELSTSTPGPSSPAAATQPKPFPWGGGGQPYRLLHVSPEGLPYREEVLL